MSDALTAAMDGARSVVDQALLEAAPKLRAEISAALSSGGRLCLEFNFGADGSDVPPRLLVVLYSAAGDRRELFNGVEFDGWRC